MIDKLAALNAHYEQNAEYAVEKALRGETLTGEEMKHGTRGIPARAFEYVGDDAWRLSAEALAVLGDAHG